MKYRLKCRYTQKRLDEISGGDFTKQLQTYMCTSGDAHFVTVPFGYFTTNEPFRRQFSATFSRDDIEAIPAIYDPTT